MTEIKNFKLIYKQKTVFDRACYTCSFCTKNDLVPPYVRNVCEKISGREKYCCSFCLRHGFNTKKSKDVLIFSFRAVLGFYYLDRYMSDKMYLSEIRDIVCNQEYLGMHDPLFAYDPVSMFWFCDFSKVGRGKRKVKIHEPIKTLKNIFYELKFKKLYPSADESSLFNKYEKAFEVFHSKRYRPEDRKILMPTVAGCLKTKINLDKTKLFSQSYLT